MCVCKICSKHIRCASAYLYSCIRPLRPSSPSYTPRFVRTLASSTAHFLHGVQCTTPTCVQASHFCAPSQIVLWASHFCAPPQFITWASLICSTRAFLPMGITNLFNSCFCLYGHHLSLWQIIPFRRSGITRCSSHHPRMHTTPNFV